MARTVIEHPEHFWDVSSLKRENKKRTRPNPFQTPGHVVGSGCPSSLDVEASEASQPPPTLLEPERPKDNVTNWSQSNRYTRETSAPDELADPPSAYTTEHSGLSTGRLTTANVEKLNEKEAVEDGSTLKPCVRTAKTPNERLAQARNFLSDEDFFCYRGFADDWREVDDLLRELSDERKEFDVNLYEEVKAMLWVHKQCMDKVKNPEPPPIDYHAQGAPFSRRLPSDHPAAKEEAEIMFRRDDHPPFTIERKPDHLEFLRVFRSNVGEGKELRSLESRAYFATLKDPKQVNDKAHMETFQTRASQRGSRRAAIQTALRTLARNTEQHYKGDWMNRVITLPQPVPETPEPVMFMSLPKDERPASPDPFEYTKKNLEYQSQQRNIKQFKQSGHSHKGAKCLTVAEIAQPLSSEPLPSDPAKAEEKALSLIRDKVLRENHLDYRPRRLDHAALWSFVSDIPDVQENKSYFHLDRWTGWEQPTEVQSPEPPQGALDDIDQDPSASADPFRPSGQSRTNHAVPYTSLDPKSTKPSYRLPPEEMGLVLVKEDARPPTPQAGTGGPMPLEIANFDHAREEHTLDYVPDPLEKRWGNRTAEMPFPETGIAQARMNRQIERDLKRGLAAEPGYDFESDDESEVPDNLQTQTFRLPFIAEDLSISALSKANKNTTKHTKPAITPLKKRTHNNITSDNINTIVSNEDSSAYYTTAPSPAPHSSRSFGNPPTPSPTTLLTQKWAEKLQASPSAKRFKNLHGSYTPIKRGY